MKTYRQTLGSWGEQVAVDYLQSHGYLVLGQNVRTAYGEIDVVALTEASGNGQILSDQTNLISEVVFIEVKTRASAAYGLPEEAITAKKKDHLLLSAQAYMQDHPELPGAWRVDVIAIRCQRDDTQPEIVHFKNAVV